MKKIIFLSAALLLVGAGCSATTNVTTTPDKVETGSQTSVTQPGTSTTGSMDNTEKDDNGLDVGIKTDVNLGSKAVVVAVNAENYSFDPKEIKVKKGDKVQIVFKNIEGMHDWKLEGYNVGTKMVAAGKTETVEFTADKAGTFEYYCSVGNHRQMGMKGNLIVE